MNDTPDKSEMPEPDEDCEPDDAAAPVCPPPPEPDESVASPPLRLRKLSPRARRAGCLTLLALLGIWLALLIYGIVAD